MTDDPPRSAQAYCANCRYTIRVSGVVTAQLLLAEAASCRDQGHDVEVTVPAPSGSLADRFGITAGNTITGRW